MIPNAKFSTPTLLRIVVENTTLFKIRKLNRKTGLSYLSVYIFKNLLLWEKENSNVIFEWETLYAREGFAVYTRNSVWESVLGCIIETTLFKHQL